jgi:hypothetical protein
MQIRIRILNLSETVRYQHRRSKVFSYLQRIEPADAHVLEKYLKPGKMANGDN